MRILFAIGLSVVVLLLPDIPASLAQEAGTTALAAETAEMDSQANIRAGSVVSAKIASDFSDFAGSESNADALVTGIRTGTSVTLNTTDAGGTATTTTFDPPTGEMGYGNVYMSLALARQELINLGITEPTAQQIEAALVGGTVTGLDGQATAITGVLELRAQGMGWGEIAQSYGYKLGPVISSMRSANASVAAAGTIDRTPSASAAASGAPAAASRPSGIVTATGSAAAPGGARGKAYGRSIVNGAGLATTRGAAGQGHAYGRGVVTGAGSAAPSVAGGQGNAYGRGIVTGSGGAAAGQAGSHSQGRGKGFGNAGR